MGAVFDENSDSITGLRTQDGKNVYLEEENFASLVDGKVNTLLFKESATKKRVQQVERFFSVGKAGEGFLFFFVLFDEFKLFKNN